MNIFKTFVLILLMTGLGLNSTPAQKKNVNSKIPKAFNKPGFQTDLKVLSQGNQSKVDKPFIFVARDEITYALLQSLVEGLPAPAEIDFTKNAVVAGFAGTRPNGGYSVDIQNSQNIFAVKILTPGKGMMVTQIITAPYKIVQAPISQNTAVSMMLSTDFTAAAENYRLSKGDFGFTGGFAGRKKDFTAKGAVSILTFGDLATFTFDLNGQGTEEKRSLAETASGTLKKGMISLARLDAGSFADNPHPPFSVSGNLIDSTLTLSFAPLPTNFADGYIGHGNLSAIKAGSGTGQK